MKRSKTSYLGHRGYIISGKVLVDSSTGETDMSPVFLPKSKLTHGNIKRCINTGGLVSGSIISATVNIHSVHGLNNQHKELVKTLYLNKEQCKYSFKIIHSI